MPYTNLLFLILIFISYTKADLPVHCLVSDITGDWVIRVNKEKFDAQPEDFRTTCGHGLPNKVDASEEARSGSSWGAYNDFEVKLKSDYKVYQNDVYVGHWTPVYDQSFVIYYKRAVLTAPYKYFKNSNGDYKSDCKNTLVGWYTPDYNQTTKNWSCFYAFRKGSNLRSFLQIENKETVNPNAMSFAQIQKTHTLHGQMKYENFDHVVSEINNANLTWKAEIHDEFRGMSLLQLRSHLGMRKGQVDKLEMNIKKNNDIKVANLIQMSKTDKMDAELKEFMEKINSEERKIEKLGNALEERLENVAHIKGKVHTSTETVTDAIAGTETETETEASTEASTEGTTEGHKISPIYEVAGAKKSTLADPKHHSFPEPGRDKDSKYVDNYAEVSKYLHTPLEVINEETLPKNWDWRNVGGVNYVPTIKRQGSCGSCYVFSTITCLESRLRIQTNNKDRTQFSKQYPISCNFYSEGCDGGYPFLVGKFLHEFEIVPESCFTYTQTNDSCSNVCDYKSNPKQYKVSEYGYLGGYYGATNEILMMKELRARGPIPGNIRVPFSFNLYKSGVFSESSLIKNSDKLSKTTLVDRHLSWEKVEHSITLVGYGEEDGVKYWIGMNTWGTNWGDQGFFKILRGENECNVESMGDFINIEVRDRKFNI